MGVHTLEEAVAWDVDIFWSDGVGGAILVMWESSQKMAPGLECHSEPLRDLTYSNLGGSCLGYGVSS